MVGGKIMKNKKVALIGIIMVGLLSFVGCAKISDYFNKSNKTKYIFDILLILLFIVTIFYVVVGSYNPFIYFRF